MQHARVFVIDGHAIYRRGIFGCLQNSTDATPIGEAAGVESARRDPRLAEATLVLIDHGLPGARTLIRELHERGDVSVIVCSQNLGEDEMLASIEAGARGFLPRETLTAETLAAAIDAAGNGEAVVDPELLGSLLEGLSRAAQDVLAPNGVTLARLTARERSVLRLIADGYQTREVAEQLSYSERTIKNVVHDITTKLDARSRSQAVAYAVREGLI